jgi:hypothetical protein
MVPAKAAEAARIATEANCRTRFFVMKVSPAISRSQKWLSSSTEKSNCGATLDDALSTVDPGASRLNGHAGF